MMLDCGGDKHRALLQSRQYCDAMLDHDQRRPDDQQMAFDHAMLPTVTALASDTGLTAALADTDTKTTYNVLGKPAAGLPSVCIKTGGVGDALNVNGNWNKPGHSSLMLAQITTEINAKRPIAIDIKWHSGAQHCIAIAGVLDDMLLICDPIYGESVIQYEAFPAEYHGGASLVSACLTQKKA
jgi:hypothetical protein